MSNNVSLTCLLHELIFNELSTSEHERNSSKVKLIQPHDLVNTQLQTGINPMVIVGMDNYISCELMLGLDRCTYQKKRFNVQFKYNVRGLAAEDGLQVEYMHFIRNLNAKDFEPHCIL